MLTSEQCRVGRAFLGLTQTAFASLAKIAVESIQGFEKGRLGLSERSILKIRTAFVREGIEFLDDENGVGVRRKLKLEELDRLALLTFKATPPGTISAAECRAARGLLGWTRDEISQHTGLDRHILSSFENGASVPMPANRLRIRRAFDAAGIFFERAGAQIRVTLLHPAEPYLKALLPGETSDANPTA